MSKVHTHIQSCRYLEKKDDGSIQTVERNQATRFHTSDFTAVLLSQKRKALLVCEFSTSTHKWEWTGAVEYMVTT